LGCYTEKGKCNSHVDLFKKSINGDEMGRKRDERKNERLLKFGNSMSQNLQIQFEFTTN
jgi:hypothetical protein